MARYVPEAERAVNYAEVMAQREAVWRREGMTPREAALDLVAEAEEILARRRAYADTFEEEKKV